jgi:Tfp pilus assembly protein PilF
MAEGARGGRLQAGALAKSEAPLERSRLALSEDDDGQAVEPVQEALAQARAAFDDEDFIAVGKALDEALYHDPQCEEALFLFGCMMLHADHPAIARISFEDCLRRGKLSEGNLAQCYANLGRSWEGLERYDRAQEYYERGLKVRPDSAASMLGLSTVAVMTHRFEDSITLAQKSLQLAETFQARVNMAYSHLNLGDHARGWELYAAGVGHQQWRERKFHTVGGKVEPVFAGEPDARILITAEQGIGDQIAFCSALPDMMSCYNVVGLECAPKLERLFKLAFPQLEHIHGTQFVNKVDWDCGHSHVMAMSEILQYVRKQPDDFNGKAFLKPDPVQQDMWRKYLEGDTPVIGIAYRGGSHKTHGWRRKSADLDYFARLFNRFPFAHFVSLEYKEPALQDYPIHDYPWATWRSTDYADTAALVSSLDALVTVPTSVNHLAGALGVPVFTMVHDRAHFHYGLGMPYYESVRCYERDKLDTALNDLEALLC